MAGKGGGVFPHRSLNSIFVFTPRINAKYVTVPTSQPPHIQQWPTYHSPRFAWIFVFVILREKKKKIINVKNDLSITININSSFDDTFLSIFC